MRRVICWLSFVAALASAAALRAQGPSLGVVESQSEPLVRPDGLAAELLYQREVERARQRAARLEAWKRLGVSPLRPPSKVGHAQGDAWRWHGTVRAWSMLPPRRRAAGY